MPRIPLVARAEDLPAAHRDVWSRIAQSRGRVVGPFAALLHSPVLADRTASLGAFVRFESTLPGDVREIVILSVARVFDCRFEWAYHVPEAKKAGVPAATIAAIRARTPPADADEAAIVAYVSELLVTHRASDATVRALRERLGLEGVVELTATVGYYAMLACTLNAFDVRPDSNEEDLDVP
ncbi:MAG TPA: carboxymuconolactone decarboxylase family protein [Methylomirabilota bacterium]|jgi:4-carboxymuconolactone decarboxylase|nr:carboxymuconolactone decarboxylase family protein [Methylomirabilota bacterium]